MSAVMPTPTPAQRGLSRVVVTGMGIVSCLGNTLDEVSAGLREGRSGITRVDAWRERGLASQVAGVASVANEPAFDRKLERFMGDTARFACHAARKAIDDAGLDPATLRSPFAGAVIGSGTGTISAYDAAMAIAHERGIERVLPYAVPQVMGSTASANVAQVFGLEGVTYSPSSACTTSALAIGQAMQLIQTGRQQIVLAGGSEGLHDNTTLLFDAMGALSRGFNDTPERASRPYDSTRDGFVIASGGGVLVLESLDHAQKRNAPIVAELVGYGMAGDANHITQPAEDGNGAYRVMRAAIRDAGIGAEQVGYVNAHGTSTPLGDAIETLALKRVFGEHAKKLPVSSTKSMTGHLLGGAGGLEAGISVLALRDQKVPPTINYAHPDPACDLDYVPNRARAVTFEYALSNSFGFGGTNAALLFKRWQ